MTSTTQAKLETAAIAAWAFLAGVMLMRGAWWVMLLNLGWAVLYFYRLHRVLVRAVREMRSTSVMCSVCKERCEGSVQ